MVSVECKKEIPRISRIPKVHYRITSVRHLSLYWASTIQSIYPHPTSWRSILILSTHLRLGLPSGIFPSGFPTKTLYTSLSSPIRSTCPAHLILLDFISRTILGEDYKSFSSSLCNLLHSPVTSSLLGPNILLNTMFSNTLSFLSSRNVNDQISHPYKTRGKIIVLYICECNIVENTLLCNMRTINSGMPHKYHTLTLKNTGFSALMRSIKAIVIQEVTLLRYFTLFFLWRCGPTRAMASSFLRFLDHTQRRITFGRTSLNE